MGSVSSYTTIPDPKRRDATEGHAFTREPGIITIGLVSPSRDDQTIWTQEAGYRECHGETTNPVFCFCTFLPQASLNHISDNYGRYIVKIGEPRKLAEEIRCYLRGKARNCLIRGCEVVYNKGQELDHRLTVNERADLDYTQKPFKEDGREYHKDHEFRFVVIDFESNQDPFIEVNLNKRLDYLSLVRPK